MHEPLCVCMVKDYIAKSKTLMVKLGIYLMGNEFFLVNILIDAMNF